MASDNERVIDLPKTFAAIQAEFPGKGNRGLRKRLWESALAGQVNGCRDVALTACGEASLAEVAAVHRAEMRELGLADSDGYPLYEIGVNECGEAVAFLDQPVPTYTY